MLLDVNVLVALSWDHHIHHSAAHERFSELTSWSTCPTTEAGLIRILMNENVVGRAVSGAEALGHLDAIRSTPGWKFLPDDSSLAAPVIDTRVLMGRRQVTDLQLVNLAAKNNSMLATFDASLKAALAPDDRHWVEVWHG